MIAATDPISQVVPHRGEKTRQGMSEAGVRMTGLPWVTVESYIVLARTKWLSVDWLADPQESMRVCLTYCFGGKLNKL